MFWTVLGFVGGIALSQNSRQMSTPSQIGVFFFVFVAAGFMFYIGWRGKAIAVATAVATAVANANAEAEANAAAIATSAVNLYMDGMQPRQYLPQASHVIPDHSQILHSIQQSHMSSETSYDDEYDNSEEYSNG